jgi:hypothetical protein
MAEETAKIRIDTSVDNKGLEKGLAAAGKTVKEFAKGFGNELLGVDSLLQSVAGGPVAIGQKVAEMVKAGVAELDEWAGAWRAADEAAKKLAHAAESNPYLNGRAVKELRAFADELEIATGLDGDMALAAASRLASIGRTQEQIAKTLRTAADLDASGLMSFDEAVQELNNSYNGLIRTSGRLAPELKNLTQEELAAGRAVDVLAGKVEGSAARAMETAGGSVKAYETAVSNLKKAIGGGWEEATAPARRWTTSLVNQINEALSRQKSLAEAIGDASSSAAELAEINEGAARALGREYADALNQLAGIRESLAETGRTEGGWLRDQMGLLSTMSGKTRGQIADLAKAYGEFDESVRPAVMAALDFEIAQRDAARAAEERRAAIAAGDKAARDASQARIADEKALADIKRKNQAALDAEIAKIQEMAAIEGKSVESAETRRRIMEARVNAYYSLLEEGREYIEALNAEKGAELGALSAGMERVRGLESAEAESEKAREAAARAEGERQAKRIKDIDDAIEAHGRLAASMTDLAESARMEREKKSRAAAVREALIAENEARDEALARRLAEIQTEKEFEIKALEKSLEEQRKLNERALKDIAEDAVSTEEEKAAKIGRINDRMAAAEEGFQNYRVELERRTEEDILAAHEEAAQRMEEREREKYERIAGYVGQYAGLVQSAASAIHDIWSGVIQAELDERLDALDKENLSAEERAEAEKQLRKTAAEEEYKAAAFQWTMNMALAAANAAQAVLAALANPGGPAGIALAAVAGALGALQVAAIAAAKPKKPSFHTGGVVAGRGEVDATLLGGEVVQTSAQFKTVMEAMANLAAIDAGAAKASGPNIVVNNNAADSARVGRPQIDGDRIIFTIERIVNETIAGGKADAAFERRDAYGRGQSLMPF